MRSRAWLPLLLLAGCLDKPNPIWGISGTAGGDGSTTAATSSTTAVATSTSAAQTGSGTATSTTQTPSTTEGTTGSGPPPWVVFDEPQAIDELNDPAFNDDDPSVRFDDLEMYWSTDRQNGENVWRATRLTPNDPWGNLELVAEIQAVTNSSITPALSRDGLTMTVASLNGVDQGEDVFVTTRTGLDANWGPPVLLDGLQSPTNETGAVLVDGGLAVYFCSNRDGPSLLYRGRRNDAVAAFSGIEQIMIPPFENDVCNLWVSEDEDLLAFRTAQSGSTDRDIWLVRGEAGVFGPPLRASDIATPFNESDPWLVPGPDGFTGRIYFSREETIDQPNLFVANYTIVDP